MAAAPPAPASSGPAPVSLSPHTLVFSDARREAAFRAHQRSVWRSTDAFRLRLNLLAGLINLSITAYALREQQASPALRAATVLPYLAVAVLHYAVVVCWRPRACRGSLANHAGELAYSLICTLSMPTWVLHRPCAEAKVFLRQLVLGSGILIGIWCRFLTPTFFATACWLVPLQFAFQAAVLSRPTCRALAASGYGSAALRRLLWGLDALTAWVLPAASPLHAGGGGDVVRGCCSAVLLLQLCGAACLLYLQYRLERGTRLAFLKGSVAVARDWPRVPSLAQLVLHSAVALQLTAAAWLLLRGAAGGAAPAAGSAGGA